MGFLKNAWRKLFGNNSTEFDMLRNFGINYPNHSSIVTEKEHSSGFSSGFGADSSRFGALIDSVIARLAGHELTGAEREANEFSANQAELAFNRELEASNTAYQRKVEDMKNAGINPMMAVSSGVSLPAASSASSVSPSAAAFQLNDLLNIALLPLQAQQMKANISKTEAETSKISAEESSVLVGIEKVRSEVRNLNIDYESKKVVYSYLDRLQDAELRLKNASIEQYETSVAELNKRIEKMSFEELSIFISACDTAEHISYLRSEEVVNEVKAREFEESIKKLNKETKILQLNIDNFDDITVLGSTSETVGVGPFRVGENRPVTLRDMKARAQALKDSKKDLEKNKSRSMKDIKSDYPE